MYPIPKLARLRGRARIRKAALILEEAERLSMSGDAEGLAYARRLAAFLVDSPESASAVAAASHNLVQAQGGEDSLRALDRLRHLLIRESGQAPADWDLINPATGRLDDSRRRASPGLKAYLEDIRSPFNIGSIFRSAEAFGFEELLLSPDCAAPEHPRALRSSMGAISVLPWRRAGLEALETEEPVFALELGGRDLAEFVFPPRGILVLGSEELGVSKEARGLCRSGVVSIALSGLKASLNVGVAFGIVAQAWAAETEHSRTR